MTLYILTQELAESYVPGEKLVNYLRDKGEDVCELLIDGCRKEIGEADIVDDRLYYTEPKNGVRNALSFKHGDSVIKRSWDGGVQSKVSTDIQEFMEQKGVYADNAAGAIRITHNRFTERAALKRAGLSVPETYNITSIEDNSLSGAIEDLTLRFSAKNLKDETPAFVMKRPHSSGGNNIRFYALAAVDSLKQDASQELIRQKEARESSPSVIVEEYIPPLMRSGALTDVKKQASHLRVIISRTTDNDQPWKCIGFMRCEREGEYISNTSYKKDGHPVPGNVTGPEDERESFPHEMISRLGKAMEDISGLNQGGFDLIPTRDSDGRTQYYAIEVNDGMGICSFRTDNQGVLDKQETLQHYANSHIARRDAYVARVNEQTVSTGGAWVASVRQDSAAAQSGRYI